MGLDGAKRLGAKILVAGGGRCNVTHHAVDESAYAGTSREMIRRVLRRFNVPRTIEFFRELGVELKREETGKLFPTTDSARTVLDALLRAARDAGVELRHPWRAGDVRQRAERFEIAREDGPGMILAHRLILATGGRALPKSGSDGHGYVIARSLGHSVTKRIFPALVPLTLPKDHFVCSLSGLSTLAALELRSASGKRLASFTNSTLCTHFGLSGPAVLDISRYWTEAVLDARERGTEPPSLVINWLPAFSPEMFDRKLIELPREGWRGSVARLLRQGADPLPERLVDALCAEAGFAASGMVHQLTREQRRSLVRAVTELELPVTGDRGYTHAEATAGGVPLAELNLKTMESRITSGLYICGEICDVDGRIGGFNFQWAWASGFVAGSSAGDAATT